MKQSHLLLGEIVRPQGIKGEVKLKHYTDDPSRFLELETAYVKRGERFEPIQILNARLNKGDVYLTIEGVETRNDAEALRGTMLYIDRAHARELNDNEVFIADIIGAKAYDTKGEFIGTLKDVLKPGSTDVFVFDTQRGEMMMPALERVIKVMDADECKLVLDETTLGEVALYEDSDTDALS